METHHFEGFLIRQTHLPADFYRGFVLAFNFMLGSLLYPVWGRLGRSEWTKGNHGFFQGPSTLRHAHVQILWSREVSLLASRELGSSSLSM